jgi:hypothetical protein
VVRREVRVVDEVLLARQAPVARDGGAAGVEAVRRLEHGGHRDALAAQRRGDELARALAFARALRGECAGEHLGRGNQRGAPLDLFDEDARLDQAAVAATLRRRERRGEPAVRHQLLPQRSVGAPLAFAGAHGLEGRLSLEQLAQVVAQQGLGLVVGKPHRGILRPRVAMIVRCSSLAPPPKRRIGEARQVDSMRPSAGASAPASRDSAP